MGDINRTIIIKLNSKYSKKGGIPISILSATLNSFQLAAYHIGNSLIKREPSTVGRYLSGVKRELELFFMKAEKNSLTASLELPEKEANLFPQYPDFGEKVASDLNSVLQGMKRGFPSLIHKTIPDAEYRKKVLEDLIPILPKKDSDYEISFRFGNNPIISAIERPDDELINEYIGPIPKGRKEKAHVAMIQAQCLARINKNGSISRIEEILNYELFDEIDLRPFRTSQIQWQNRAFFLKKEIACDVHKEESIVIIEYEPLKIRAYNYSREVAINDFSEIFSMIWDNYAGESEKNLTKDAINLKRTLLALVEKIDNI